jgi:hypothetical protein
MRLSSKFGQQIEDTEKTFIIESQDESKAEI